MKIYNIPCTWTVYGNMAIEAETLKDAIEYAHSNEPLPDGDYLPDSFKVDHGALHLYNDEDILKEAKK